MMQEKQPEILTMKQACELLNCHPNTLRNWEKEGVVECIRFGKRRDRRFRKAEILKLLEEPITKTTKTSETRVKELIK